MSLDLENLIGRGYFPKELPPPFSTIELANNFSIIKNKWENPGNSLVQERSESQDDFDKRKENYNNHTKSSNKNSKCGIYSITKSLLCRRYLEIPNPIHFIKLADKIVSNWDAFESKLAEDRISMSSPVFQESIYERCFRTKSLNYTEFITKTIDISFKHKIELKLDISMFYHRIYTHSIPWALLSKDRAKEIFKNKKKFRSSTDPQDSKDWRLYEIGDEIDKAARACQEDQTIGIPVGPDTSFIIAELILSEIDRFIAQQEDISTCRYFDDYYIYTDSKQRADDILKRIEQLLLEYNLQINESKVSIKEYPFHFIEDFTIELRNFNLDNNFEYTVKQYFSIVWKFASQSSHKKSQILSYSLRIFDSEAFDQTYFEKEKNWMIFEDLMFKSLLICPSIIDDIYKILLRRRGSRDSLPERTKGRLQIIISKILDSHTETNESFEVSWSLWLCKVFNLSITKDQASRILKMKDSITRLILLDIIHSKDINLKDELTKELSQLCEKLVSEGLLGENWLLLYEGILNNWLNIDENIVKKNHYFNLLLTKQISFYDSDPSLNLQSVEYVFEKRKMDKILREQARKEAEDIFYDIISEKAEEMYEEEAEENIWEYLWDGENYNDKDKKQKRIDQIISKLQEDPEYRDLEDELFNDILDKKASNEPIDQTELLESYLSKLNYYSRYK